MVLKFIFSGKYGLSYYLRIDYGDGRVIRGSSTKMVISQLWVIIFRHAYIIKMLRMSSTCSIVLCGDMVRLEHKIM